MDISTEVAAIQAASQGSELRQPLVGALNKLNTGSLPAVTASDVGKILKVGANGWEVGEKSGYMPVPSATKQISDNGTYDITDYSSAVVNVNPSGVTLISKTINQNGTYNPADDNADGYDEVVVNVSGGGGTNILFGITYPDSNIGINGSIYLQTLGILQNIVTQQSQLNVIVTANSNWSGYDPWKAFTASSGWIGNGGNPHWLKIEFTQRIALYIIEFKSFDSSRSHAISHVLYSEDDVNYSEATLAESTMANNIGRVVLDNAYTAKYFKLCFDGNYSISDYPMVSNLLLYGAGDTIYKSYCKVNGLWQDLIGTDIDDINTGS